MEAINKLADAIAAIRKPDFGLQVANYLHQQIYFDHLLMLGCRTGKHPIYLYDSLAAKREFLFQRYLTGSYLDDPFYRAAQTRTASAVLRLQDVIDDAHVLRQYQQTFTTQTAMYDELCLFIRLDEQRWVFVFFGYLDEDNARYQAVHSKLTQLQPLLVALFQQHWAQDGFALSHSAANKTGLQTALAAALASFGEGSLSAREQEITLLLIQGFDSQEIATSIGITVGTVKNHRKKIYAKLHIASLSELFQLFLTHLLAS